MTNYIKRILTSGLVAGMLAFNPGCGSDAKGPEMVIQDAGTSDTYSTDSNMDDSYIMSDADSGIDALIEDAQEVSSDTKIDSDVEDSSVSPDASADTEVGYDASADTEVGYDASADTEVSSDASADTEVSSDASADTEVSYDASADTEVGYDASADTEVGYDASADAEVEEILSCTNLNQVPTCLGEGYTGLFPTGIEVSKALDFGINASTETENPNIYSGNPCNLPEYFTGTCVDWVSSEPAGISTVRLIDQDTVEIKGNLLERIAALTKVANGETQGTECVIKGTDPNTAEVLCNEE